MNTIKYLTATLFIVLFTSNTSAQTSDNNKPENQPSKIVLKINSMIKEYIFSKGVSKYDPFILNGYILKQAQYTYNLKKVKIYAVEVGIKFLCYDSNNDCVKVIDPNTKEISYEPWILYPFDDQELTIKLLTEFCRLKNLLNINN